MKSIQRASMRRLSVGFGLNPTAVPDQQTRREIHSFNLDELVHVTPPASELSDHGSSSEDHTLPSPSPSPNATPNQNRVRKPKPNRTLNRTPSPIPNPDQSVDDVIPVRSAASTMRPLSVSPSQARRRFSLGSIVTRLHTFEQSIEEPSADGNRFQVAVRRVIYLKRLIRMLKSRDRRQVERACEKLLDIVNAPQNSDILHDLNIEPVLLSLLSLDPLGHWKIVGYALHGLFTLALNPKCSRVIIKTDDIDAILEQYIRSERVLVQRLTAGIVCRLFTQPITQEWKLFTQGAVRMVSLLLSLLSSSSGAWEMQLEALGVCNELTYHLDHTIILCQRPEFMARISELVLVSDIRVRHLALLVLRNVVCSAQVNNVILRAVRDVAKDLEKGLLTQLEAVAYQETMHANSYKIESKEQLFVVRARESECHQLLLETLWFIRTCFSRLRKDSVQPEDSAAEFHSRLKQSASRFVP